MKTLLFASFGVAVTGLAIGFATSRGHAQAQPAAGDYGPGPQGAALVPAGGQATSSLPASTTPANPAVPGSGFDPRTYGAANPLTANGGGVNVSAYTDASAPWAGLPTNSKGGAPQQANPLPHFEERPDINQDIAVTADLGPYMICVITYFGEKAPQMARDMVMELRNTYKLPAYVFNHGAVERRKEYDRVKALIQQRRQAFREHGVPDSVPIRVPCLLSVEDQCGVLVGGYPNDEAAEKAVKSIRNLPRPDPNKVHLDVKFQGRANDRGELVNQEGIYVNPFQRAFVGRNPATKAERAENKLKFALLEQLNRDEPFSLLNCPKKVTLVLKQVITAEVVAGQQVKGAKPGTFLASMLGFGKKESHDDNAATAAHNLAEMLRKMNIDAYVLHTKYSSIVTVGAFDRIDDPALYATQQRFQTQIRLDEIKPYPIPIPWEFWNSIERS
jgi:hypothetical protein